MKLSKQVAFAAILCIVITGCSKNTVKNGRVDQPGVAFTFDDSNVDNWYTYLPLFDSFGVKATFYISNYKLLNSSQVAKLHETQLRGHEIAFHSTNHYNMKQYLNNATMDQLIDKEIKAGLKKMNADGFYPRTFAYPFGQHTTALDYELLKYFKSVRALNGTSNLAKSLATACDNRILYGLGIDDSSKRPIGTILQLMENSKNGKACLVLVAHHINVANTRLQLPEDRLRTLIEKASALHLKFYTVSEISN